MPKRLIFVLAAALLSANASADAFDTTLERFRAAPGTARFFEEAYGYAVFPHIGKGGFGVGAAHGKGRVYRKGDIVGRTAMTQISVGFQIGGQAFSQIVFFRNEAAYERFTNGSFEFGAEASAVAATLGVSARAGTTGRTAGRNESRSENSNARAQWSADMATFTLAKGGFMYEAAIGGQKFTYEPLDGLS